MAVTVDYAECYVVRATCDAVARRLNDFLSDQPHRRPMLHLTCSPTGHVVGMTLSRAGVVEDSWAAVLAFLPRRVGVHVALAAGPDAAASELYERMSSPATLAETVADVTEVLLVAPDNASLGAFIAEHCVAAPPYWHDASGVAEPQWQAVDGLVGGRAAARDEPLPVLTSEEVAALLEAAVAVAASERQLAGRRQHTAKAGAVVRITDETAEYEFVF